MTSARRRHLSGVLQGGGPAEVSFTLSETQFDRLPECLCGGPMCRGKVTRDDWKRQDLRRRYLLSFSNHVLELMAQEDQWLKPE